MDWDIYWNTLIEEKKLTTKIEELDQVDKIRGNSFTTETICHKIYDNYFEEWKPHLEVVKQDFLKLIDTFEGVHLQTSRIKTIDSLLVKVISKRYKNFADENNLYSSIDGDNYKEIVTDLLGMRLIINYRGKWNVIHEEIMRHFPYVDEQLYKKHGLVPIKMLPGNAMAEKARVYYAEGDAIDEYKKYGLDTKRHNMGYRSIHYTISFENVYVEIQVRTIYDEAWSDCDHNYVYKQDENKSHTALEQLSQILCQLTNISNDMGENMREIFEQEKMIDMRNGKWKTTKECLDSFDHALERVKKAYKELEDFRKKLVT